jgi:hypothetical protein
VDLVSKLLDDVLIENGLTIPTHRRREFALALLKARVRTLEVGVRRTKGEIRGERVEDQGITVDALLDAYLSERRLRRSPKLSSALHGVGLPLSWVVGIGQHVRLENPNAVRTRRPCSLHHRTAVSPRTAS